MTGHMTLPYEVYIFNWQCLGMFTVQLV